MYLQTPKRPSLPSLHYSGTKTSLPPLSSLLQKEDFLPLPSTKPRLPSIDIFATPNKSPVVEAPNTSFDSDADDSMIKPATKRKLNQVSPSDTKAFAFISHSPATFPSQEPSIDNAPLARRKRRRTSPNELSILNSEFELGATPNKLRRIEIAKKVCMSEKAVQIWFQNKRQSIRKQSSNEKEICELLPTPDSSYPYLPSLIPMNQQQQPQPLISSTPIKPVVHRFQSQPFIHSPPNPSSPVKVRSASASNISPVSKFPTPFLTPNSSKSSLSISDTTSVSNDIIDTSNIQTPNLVLNETKKKQPIFLNSNISSTMTFKLAPAKVALPEERKPLAPLDPNALGKKKGKKVEECIENLLSLRSGQWK